MSIDQIIITTGAVAGGFISGLAGFGTGLVAIGIWLHAVSPAVATSIAMICSIVAQVQTIPSVWHAIQPRRVLPFVIPGLIGVPIGAHFLAAINPNTFRFGMGLLLIGFSTFFLCVRKGLNIAWGGRTADSVVGLTGGILGGLAGLSGPIPTMWAAVRGWHKDERRGLFQAFNLSILLAALLSRALTGQLTAAVGWATITALPGTFVGAWLGARAYRRLSDHHFHNIILYLLAFSGMMLLRDSW